MSKVNLACLLRPKQELLNFMSSNMLAAWSSAGSVVDWFKHRADDQHGLGSKPTCAILLCSWER